MFNAKLFRHSLLLLLIIAVLFQVSEILHLSWTFWWFDMVLHFLGGFWVGMIVFLIWNHYFGISALSRVKVIVLVIAGTLLVGIAWEVFELYFGVTSLSDGAEYNTDTLSDLVLDVCGGFFATLYAYNLESKNTL